MPALAMRLLCDACWMGYRQIAARRFLGLLYGLWGEALDSLGFLSHR